MVSSSVCRRAPAPRPRSLPACSAPLAASAHRVHHPADRRSAAATSPRSTDSPTPRWIRRSSTSSSTSACRLRSRRRRTIRRRAPGPAGRPRTCSRRRGIAPLRPCLGGSRRRRAVWRRARSVGCRRWRKHGFGSRRCGDDAGAITYFNPSNPGAAPDYTAWKIWKEGCAAAVWKGCWASDDTPTSNAPTQIDVWTGAEWTGNNGGTNTNTTCTPWRSALSAIGYDTEWYTHCREPRSACSRMGGAATASRCRRAKESSPVAFALGGAATASASGPASRTISRTAWITERLSAADISSPMPRRRPAFTQLVNATTTGSPGPRHSMSTASDGLGW